MLSFADRQLPAIASRIKWLSEVGWWWEADRLLSGGRAPIADLHAYGLDIGLAKLNQAASIAPTPSNTAGVV